MPNVPGISTAAGVPLTTILDRGGAVTPETNPGLAPLVQYYQHFDLTTEQLGHTTRYNCWAFTFLPRRYWIGSQTDVDQILNDNCVPVAVGSLLPGDVIRYKDANNVTTHTGRVWEVNAAGQCTLVRSKWGPMAEYVHIPLHPFITPTYGTNLAFFRQVKPLRGLGDLWLRDSAADTGEQCSSALWTSPDILVDAPPLGSVDANPVFNRTNRVWAVVHNRSNADIKGVRVRYCWADPHAGFAASNWKLIPATSGHPNPTDTFTVPAGGSARAPYVEWVPRPVPGVADPAHQCLLTVAYVTDDPKDSTDPNPIVYPFDIRWDNNIAARNVHVLTLRRGEWARLELGVAIPFDRLPRLVTSVRARLSFVPRLPVFGYPASLVPPNVQVTLGTRPAFGLKTGARVAPLGKAWGPNVRARDFDFELLEGRREGMPTLPAEKTIAWRTVENIALTAGKTVPVAVKVEVPPGCQPGSNYYLRLEQLVHGQVTGCYTVVISVVG
jgi:hypothetical protein